MHYENKKRTHTCLIEHKEYQRTRKSNLIRLKQPKTKFLLLGGGGCSVSDKDLATAEESQIDDHGLTRDDVSKRTPDISFS